jgi:hypothetical protein
MAVVVNLPSRAAAIASLKKSCAQRAENRRLQSVFVTECGIEVSETHGVHVLVAPDRSIVTVCRNYELRRIRPSKCRSCFYH